jgi:hypothetical protein
MMYMRTFRWIFSALLALSLLACHRDHGDKQAKRTIIVYLAGDNSLNADMISNVDGMLAAMKRKDCHLIVYFDGRSTDPELFEIVPDGKAGGRKEPIASYPEENSSSPATLRRVIEEAITLYPADSYGLILGSHATGWLPAATRSNKAMDVSEGESVERPATRIAEETEKPATRTFGEDVESGGSQMGIREMAAAIPSGFEFIFFDACMMSSIEVLYELRHKTKYFIATPAEIVAAGFPYAEILPDLWGNVDDLQKACEFFYNLHDKQNRNEFATITLVNATELDALYAIVHEIFQGKRETIGALSTASQIFRYPLINITNNVYFDLREFVRHEATGLQSQQFEAQLEKVVIYKDITDPFYTTVIPDKSRACGISAYIPLNAWTTWNTEYFNLAWAGIFQ